MDGLDYSPPTTMRWAVDFGERGGRMKRIARQIRGVAPRRAELRIEGGKGLAELPAIITELIKKPIRIEATIRLTPKALSVLRWGYPIDILWGLNGPRDLADGSLPPAAAAVSFTTDRENVALLPGLLEAFAGSAVEALHLPHVDAVRAIAEGKTAPAASHGQLREAAAEISGAGLSLRDRRLVVHDYLLWRVLRELYPGEAGQNIVFPGCGAGTELAYVDWEGNVYPCDSLPVRLGNLLETPFERIWRSPARRRVAETVKGAPDVPCRAAAGCFGGCRGLAYFASGLSAGREPGPPGEV